MSQTMIFYARRRCRDFDPTNSAEIGPFSCNQPGVKSSACLHYQRRRQLIGCVTPNTTSASQFLKQLQFKVRSSLLLDFVIALEWIPHKGDGLADIKALERIADKELLGQLYEPNAAGAFICPYCDRSYKTSGAARLHFQQHNGPFFLCLVPECPANVGEFRIGKSDLYVHMKTHKKGGHLSHIKAPPARPNAEEYWQRTPQETARFITQLLAQHPNVQFDQDSTLTRQTGDSATEVNAWYLELKQQATARAKSGNIRTTHISAETQARVLLYNLGQVKKDKCVIIATRANCLHRQPGLLSKLNFAFTRWGRMCLGPRPSNREWVTERCPRNARIEWTTAEAKLTNNGRFMDFGVRCIECA
ncbi:hypothetical protein RRF57_009876 [Xylaria bambusicola]|uniref:C2H2-type domain-containing protein n=1 Tax=Xylaria bambusicola TaxID=326684 RepID=A0AAN7Z984_9PEZI